MIEDKLSQEQRIRLECLAQANMVRRQTESVEQTLQRASDYERYVTEGRVSE